MERAQRLAAGTRHLHVAHARVDHHRCLHTRVAAGHQCLSPAARLSGNGNLLHVNHTVVFAAFLRCLPAYPVHRLHHLLVGRLLQRAVVDALLHAAQGNHHIAVRRHLVKHPLVRQRGVIAAAIGPHQHGQQAIFCRSLHVHRLVDYGILECLFLAGLSLVGSAATIVDGLLSRLYLHSHRQKPCQQHN